MTNAAVGLSFRAEVDPQRIERLSSVAARFEFPALSVWDDLGDPPPAPLLLTLAERDKTARLGFACLAVPKYAAWDGIAGLLAGLSASREGPVFVGLSAGAWLEQVGLKPATALQIGEAASVLSYLLEGRTSGHTGSYYSIAPGFRLNYQLPERQPSLMIGAWGKRTLHLAGQIADEVKVGGSAGPEMAALARERLTPGALDKGRDPSGIGIVMGAVTIVDEDRNSAIAEARRRAATYIPVIGHLDTVATESFPDAITAISEAMARGDRDAAAQAIPDALLSRFAFCGAPEDVIRQVEACLAGGATRVDFGSPHGIDSVSGIELIGQQVLPYFRQ